MAHGTADDVAKKWAERTSAATQAVRDGVSRVTEAPGVKAAAAADKYLAKVQANVDKFKRNSARVSVDSWKQAMLTIGVDRIATGVQAKQGKFSSFMTDFLAHLDRGKATIDAMPTGTIEQGIAKAAAQIRYNATFKRTA